MCVSELLGQQAEPLPPHAVPHAILLRHSKIRAAMLATDGCRADTCGAPARCNPHIKRQPPRGPPPVSSALHAPRCAAAAATANQSAAWLQRIPPAKPHNRAGSSSSSSSANRHSKTRQPTSSNATLMPCHSTSATLPARLLRSAAACHSSTVLHARCSRPVRGVVSPSWLSSRRGQAAMRLCSRRCLVGRLAT